jgi:hypothetical protein
VKSSALSQSRVSWECFDPLRQHTDLHLVASISRPHTRFLLSPERLFVFLFLESPVQLGPTFDRDYTDLNAKADAEKVEIDGITAGITLMYRFGMSRPHDQLLLHG